MYNANLIVNWLLAHQSMSTKKLHNLLYLCYAWTLALTNKTLFNEQFTACIHGPRIMRLVYKYPVDTILPQHANFATNFDADTYHVLQQVWQIYGKFNELELENLVLQDQAWQNARQGLKPLDRCDKLLDPTTIKRQYLQKAK